MKVVVVGGAGYIGSVTSRLLQANGHHVNILDNFSTGYVEYVEGLTTYNIDILDQKSLEEILQKTKPDVVLHFAAKIQVAESMQQPHQYFTNNTYGTMCLLDAMKSTGCTNIVFSSTAAVYGEPDSIPIHEDDKKAPVNPYGLSKHLSEQIIDSYGKIQGFNWTVFRYFNAAGAYGNIAMNYPVMTHLIPHAVEALVENRAFSLFGDDYRTPDGTCIRDYVHVEDIAKAHVIAAEIMHSGKAINAAINLGSGKGHSIKEVIQALEDVSGKKLSYTVKPRRPGDPSTLIASNERAQKLLGWKPEIDLATMVKSHLEWRLSKKAQ